MKIKLLKTLIKDEFFNDLYEVGLITSKVFEHFKRYHFVYNYMSVNKVSLSKAVFACHENLKCSERTVWRAVKLFDKILKSK